MATPGQFVEQAMLSGWEQGAGEKDAHKEQERQQKITDLLDQRDALKSKYAATLDEKGQPTDATSAINQSILANQAAIREFYHPDKNPGAIAKYGRLLMERMHMVKPQPTINIPSQSSVPLPQDSSVSLDALPAYSQATASKDASGQTHPSNVAQPGVAASTVSMSSPPAATETMVIANPKGLVAPGNLPIWNRPLIQNADGTHSSDYSVSFSNDKGQEVLVPTIVDGKFLTPDGKKPPEGSKEEKMMFARAWQHYLKTGQNFGTFDSPENADQYAQQLHGRGQRPGTLPTGPQTTVSGQPLTESQRAHMLKNQAADKAGAAGVEAGAPMSPAQTAAIQRGINAADMQADLDQKMAAFDKLYPHATEERRSQYRDMVAETMLGIKPSQEVGKWIQMPGKVNGQPVTLLYNEKDGTYKTQTGEEVPAEVLQNFIADPKQTKMSANDRLWDAYAASLGKTMDQLTMADKPGFETWLNKMKARSTTRQVAVPDRDGNVHIIDLTSMSSPVEILSPQVPAPAAPTAPSAPQGAGGAPTPPRLPHTPSGNIGNKPRAQVKNDVILNFKKATPDYTKAKNTYEDANRIAALGDKWIQAPSSEADGQFVLSLIRSEAGRVNAQEIAQVFQAGGISEAPERWASKVGHGELSPELRKQLLDFVHMQRDAAKQALDSLDNSQGSGAGQSGDFWSQLPDHNPTTGVR